DHVAADGDRQRAGVAEVDAGRGRVALGAAQVVLANPVAGDHVAGEVHPRGVGVDIEAGVAVAVERVPGDRVVEHPAGRAGQDHAAARGRGCAGRGAEPVVVGHVAGDAVVRDALASVIGEGDTAAAGVVIGDVANDRVVGGGLVEVVGDVDANRV